MTLEEGDTVQADLGLGTVTGTVVDAYWQPAYNARDCKLVTIDVNGTTWTTPIDAVESR